MKYFHFPLVVLSVAFVLFSCGNHPSVPADKESVSRKKYQELLAAKQAHIRSFLETIRALQPGLAAVEETDSFAFETAALDFTPVYGTHSDSGEVNKDFNAIFLSTVQLGATLPETMDEDYFVNDYFSVLGDLADKGTSSFDGLDSSDSRYWNTAIASMMAMDQLRYLIIVDQQLYNPGSVSAFSGSMNIANLQGRMYVYDLKKKQFAGAREFTMDGPDEISFSYEKAGPSNGYNEDPQKAAEYKFKKENREYIRGHTIGLLSEYIALPETFRFEPAQ